ncbi:MAG: T9SS type A sorting domain-containing protein, partial [Saprospiraceae bacterium]
IPNYTLPGCNAGWPNLNTTWTDNCSAGGSIAASAGPVQTNGCSQWRVYTFTVADACGNDDTETTIVTRTMDATNPNIVDIQNYTLPGCNAAWPTLSTTWTDGCSGGGNVTGTPGSVTTNGCTQTRVYTFTVADDCENQDVETTTVTRMYDVTKPNFTIVPAHITVQCNNVPSVGNPTATDACGSVSMAYDGQTQTAGACPNAYTLTRKWTATDACGNTKTATQRITVVDNIKPVLTVPGNTTIACTAPIPPLGTPAASDACGGNVVIVYLGQSSMNAACAGTYQLLRTWKATDVCGNSTVATQTIQIVDNQPPVFSASPANVTIQCHQSLPLLVNPTATDACSGPAQITYLGQIRTDGNCLYNYTLTRTWRATDLCGNSTTKAQVITVQDTQAPVFTNPPANLTVVCAPNCVPAPVTPNATDNCGTPTVTLVETQSSGDCSSGYVVTRTWTATDQCGNPKVHVQTITVLPTAPFAPTGPRAERNPASGINREQGNQLETQNATLKTVYLIPNPTSDWVSIGLSDFKGEAAIVSILNNQGQLVWEKRFDVVEETALRVNLRQQGAAEGVYTVSVRAGGEVYTKRLVLME